MIGAVPLAADLTVTSPIVLATHPGSNAAGANAGTLKVVSVLKKVTWALGDTDPIAFEGTLSVTSKQRVMGMLYATMIDTRVNISWVIYEYDPVQRAYFAAFSTTVAGATNVTANAQGVSGLIKKEGDNLELTVAPTPSADVQSPENYDFKLQVWPGPLPQQLYLAAASTRRVTKIWGRTGPATRTAP